MHVKTTTAIALIALSAFALGACFPTAPLDETGPGAVTGQSIEGTWSGVVAGTYLCEMDADTIELSLGEDTVTVSGGTVTEGMYPSISPDSSGSIEAIGDGEFVLSIDDGGELQGRIIVDPEAGHAVLILDRDPATAGSQGGYIGVLQLEALTAMNATSSDLVGTWSGTGVSVNNSYELLESVSTEITITEPDGLALTGTYGSSSISAGAGDLSVLYDNPATGLYRATATPGIVFDGTTAYGAAFAMSYDEQWLAAGFLSDDCDTDLFAQLQNQKIALYERQP